MTGDALMRACSSNAHGHTNAASRKLIIARSAVKMPKVYKLGTGQSRADINAPTLVIVVKAMAPSALRHASSMASEALPEVACCWEQRARWT